MTAKLKNRPMVRECITLEVDGTPLRLAVLRREGNNAPIFFLHGFGSTKEDYADIARFTEFDGRPVIAFDAPGCGESTCANLAKISIPFLQAVAEQLLAYYRVPRFHLVGHSMGGLTALLLAHQIGGDAILSFTNIEGNLAPKDCFLSRQIVNEPAVNADEFFDAFVLRTLMAQQFSSALYAVSLRQNVRAEAVEPIFRSMVALSDNSNLMNMFLNLRYPKMFMYGDANRSLSYLSLLEENGVRLAEIAHCGHFPMYANPPAMWAHIGQFIEWSEEERSCE